MEHFNKLDPAFAKAIEADIAARKTGKKQKMLSVLTESCAFAVCARHASNINRSSR